MQAEGSKQSPRMVITPRQIQDNSEEVRTLRTEIATLKDEVRHHIYLCHNCFLTLVELLCNWLGEVAIRSSDVSLECAGSVWTRITVCVLSGSLVPAAEDCEGTAGKLCICMRHCRGKKFSAEQPGQRQDC